MLEGPPGTGKSQTITNMIAQALAQNRSVLFVAEKMAALQVVHRRPASAGLGEFCLELHASKAKKRAVMQELKAAIDKITREKLTDVERLLEGLAVAVGPVGVPSKQAWRDSARTFYTPAALDTLKSELDSLASLLERAVSLAAKVESTFSLPPIRTLADVETAAAVAAVLHESPGAPLAVLESDAWNAPPADATALVESLRKIQRWRQQIDQRFIESVFDQEHAGDIAYVERKTSGIFGFLAILDGRFRAIKRRWISYRLASYARPLIEQANDLKLVDMYLKARETRETKAAAARHYRDARRARERERARARVCYGVADRSRRIGNPCSTARSSRLPQGDAGFATAHDTLIPAPSSRPLPRPHPRRVLLRLAARYRERLPPRARPVPCEDDYLPRMHPLMHELPRQRLHHAVRLAADAHRAQEIVRAQ